MSIKTAVLSLGVLPLFLFSYEALAWKTKAGHRLKVEPTYYFEDVGRGTNSWVAGLRGESELSVKSSSDWKLRVTPWFYSDPAALSPSERFIFDLNEASVEGHLGDWTLKTGLNQVAWGVTDVFNPLDVVSARRYTDPLNGEKRAVPSAVLSWEAESWRIEGLYVPVQLESILPGENSRWLPRDIYFRRDSGFASVVLADQFRYYYAGRAEYDDALRGNFGFRLEHHGSGLDWSAIYFQGAPIAPAIFTPFVSGTLIGDVFSAEAITLQPVYYRRQTAGLGAVLTLETVILRLAVAASDRMTRLSTLPGWSQAVVAGVEKSIPIGASTLTVLSQATYNQSEERADNTVTSLDRIFDRSWLLGLRLATSSDWLFNAAVLYDGAGPGWYGQIGAERKLSDGVTSTVQADFFTGANGTTLGTYRRNGRATVGLRFSF